MNFEQLNLGQQFSELEQLRARCLAEREIVQRVRRQAEQIAEQETEAIQKRKAQSENQVRLEQDRIDREVRDRLDQSEIDIAAQREAARELRERRLDELGARMNEEVNECRQKLQNELWVLQSVCDEANDDAPVRQAERAREIFHTQQTFIEQQLRDLESRVERVAEYLDSCHAGAERTGPPVDVELKSREASRETAVQQVDVALVAANDLERMSLPQWIVGWRLWGLGLLIFFVAAVIATAARADLTQFVNPELGKPDWEWFGVACLIGFGSAVLIVTVLLVLVQSRLRNGFEEVLQHSANAKAASDHWLMKSRLELKKIDASAESWRVAMLQRREIHAAKLQAGADEQISHITATHREQVARQTKLSEEQFAIREAEAGRQQSAAELWRGTELTRVQTQGRSEFERALQQLQTENAAKRGQLTTEESAAMASWKACVSAATELARLSRDRAAAFPRWSQLKAAGWHPSTKLPVVIPVGDILASIPAAPATGDDNVNSNLCLELPGLLNFPRDTSIAIEHDAAGRTPALEFVRAILLRLLTNIMPGRVQFTLIDPVGLGQSFSAMMHLADFDELLISNRIWTDSTQIRDRLQKVTEHMESVFQTYLRSEFETIEDYNAAAGEVAEPYHFVVVAGFPSSFTEEAARALTSVLTSGPRCGVHAIITWSPDQTLPRSFDLDNLRTCCTQFRVENGAVVPRAAPIAPAAGRPSRKVETIAAVGWEGQAPAEPELAARQELRPPGTAGVRLLTVPKPAIEFEALAPPDAADYVSLIRAVGEQSKNARRVEVSFSRIAPKPESIWTHRSADGIDIPIGRAGAARLQYMRLGRGTSQHVLVAGKTGSGKSTLLHILITNLALHYSPDEIQFYLIDFKKGVEFRTYAANKLPHARVVAIESDREFGLSVLERLDEVLQERGELFRVRGVQDVPSFRRQFPSERMPRLLLLIDEFQEFFTSEDRVSSRASLLLDRLVRQGRAFGIHVLLGSQTLGGAYSLARSTLGQVGIRIALQCSESDAHLILSEENSAARLLTRPGEAIYNDANGMVEGNHPFQIAWLEEAQRESMIHAMTQRPDYHQRADGRMIVFEGNVAPSLELCGPLNAWLKSDSDATRHFVDTLPAWIGEPVAIAAPMCVEFRRSGGQNLLIVGQEGDLADTILASIIVSWSAGRQDDTSRTSFSRGATGPHESPSVGRPDGATHSSQMIFLHDGRDRASQERFAATFPPAIAPRLSLLPASETDSVVASLWTQMNQRECGDAAPDSPEIIFAIRNIGQFRSLRRDEDDFGMSAFGAPKETTPASQLGDLIRKGPLVGIHVVIWSDTFSNAMRWLSNSLLREFDNRVAFRLNQTDSASLIDTPAAASLSQGRAILYRDQTGSAERFRPFNWPSTAWLTAISATVMHQSASDKDGLDIDQLLIE